MIDWRVLEIDFGEKIKKEVKVICIIAVIPEKKSKQDKNNQPSQNPCLKHISGIFLLPEIELRSCIQFQNGE